jgi:hypothetical protein
LFESCMKQNNDMSSMITDKEISKLIKELRMSQIDDGGVKMMHGIYSLGSYIKSIIAETLKKSNKPEMASQISISKELANSKPKGYDDEYNNSEEIEEDDEQLDLVELDMSSP